jgi:hypothetical protein
MTWPNKKVTISDDKPVKPTPEPAPPPEPPMLMMIRRQRLERIVRMNQLEREIKEDERWISYLERHPEAIEFMEFISRQARNAKVPEPKP